MSAMRRWTIPASLVIFLLGAATPHAETYVLNQHDAHIAFSISNLGLFSSSGEFERFKATLELDGAHPERTTINVDVDAASVDMPWQEGVEMLRSPNFLT